MTDPSLNILIRLHLPICRKTIGVAVVGFWIFSDRCRTVIIQNVIAHGIQPRRVARGRRQQFSPDRRHDCGPCRDRFSTGIPAVTLARRHSRVV